MSDSLPQVFAGPIVRRLTNSEIVFWYVTDQPYSVEAQLKDNAGTFDWETELTSKQWQFQIGENAYITTQQFSFPESLNPNTILLYELFFSHQEQQHKVSELLPHLLYPGETSLSVLFKPDINNLFHGSCRKPHHNEADGLVQVDKYIGKHLQDTDTRPSFLLMTGDQVYVDDVCGPMLSAIHRTIEKLKLFEEVIPGSVVQHSNDLTNHPYSFYKRELLLPYLEENAEVEEAFFKAKKKPIFTSVNAANHLISLSEVLAMYLLVWSPRLWEGIELTQAGLSAEEQEKYNQEIPVIEAFAASLHQVQRALAHIPSYMIFDDHDITDDWNLTRGWEEAAYGNPFSKRIIGNALLGYFLCQGIGNNPEQYDFLLQDIHHYFTHKGLDEHDAVIDSLLSWSHWHFELDTQPKTIILDTRTHRWRSESDPDKPSGLMDWETLSHLQNQLENEQSVIIVSPAPIFGVKLIEAIQRIFTAFGHALTVDAENWMAHPGTAKVLLDIFRHADTPQEFVILSGDVHYSFVYDVKLRFKQSSPNIHQITASGIKNQFPESLINVLDKLNRFFYGTWSPLNWFTKRRLMEISVRTPTPYQKNRTLVSRSAIGLVELELDCQRPKAKLLCHDDTEIDFEIKGETP